MNENIREGNPKKDGRIPVWGECGNFAPALWLNGLASAKLDALPLPLYLAKLSAMQQ